MRQLSRKARTGTLTPEEQTKLDAFERLGGNLDIIHAQGSPSAKRERELGMSLKDKPHYTLPATILASWIEKQPDRWWSVDGDPRLTAVVDFPCPSDELAPAIRRIGKDLLLYDKTAASKAHGEVLGGIGWTTSRTSVTGVTRRRSCSPGRIPTSNGC